MNRKKITTRLTINNVLLIFLIALLSTCLYLYLNNFIFPNTYLAYVNISGKNKNNVRKYLAKTTGQKLQIKIKDRNYQYAYSDLGIILDEESTLNTLFEPNQKKFPQNTLVLFKSFSSQRTALPTLIFTQDFYSFVQKSVFDFSRKSDEVIVDELNKNLIYQENEEKYIVDADKLKAQIVFNFGKNQPIEAVLNRIDNSQKQQVSTQNQKLENIFKKPVYAIAKDQNNTYSFTVNVADLKKIIKIKYDRENNYIQFVFDDIQFKAVVDKYIHPDKNNPDKKLSYGALKKDLTNLINSRAGGADSDTIFTKIDLSPNTDGTEAPKYIEIDISQQTIYLFQDGEIYASYKVSTGLYKPTPTGQFKILNKALNAYSDIWHVWMPYWMAFYYEGDSNSYYGIHELPYWVTRDGEKIQRPREFIGSPHTGGCVALDIGVAQNVYEFADIGMPVYVFE